MGSTSACMRVEKDLTEKERGIVKSAQKSLAVMRFKKHELLC